MKRYFISLAAVFCLFCVFTGCGSKTAPSVTTTLHNGEITCDVPEDWALDELGIRINENQLICIGSFPSTELSNAFQEDYKKFAQLFVQNRQFGISPDYEITGDVGHQDINGYSAVTFPSFHSSGDDEVNSLEAVFYIESKEYFIWINLDSKSGTPISDEVEKMFYDMVASAKIDESKLSD